MLGTASDGSGRCGAPPRVRAAAPHRSSMRERGRCASFVTFARLRALRRSAKRDGLKTLRGRTFSTRRAMWSGGARERRRGRAEHAPLHAPSLISGAARRSSDRDRRNRRALREECARCLEHPYQFAASRPRAPLLAARGARRERRAGGAFDPALEAKNFAKTAERMQYVDADAGVPVPARSRRTSTTSPRSRRSRSPTRSATTPATSAPTAATSAPATSASTTGRTTASGSSSRSCSPPATARRSPATSGRRPRARRSGR